MENVNLGLIFLTGLTTGGLTCIAVQGGLLASALSEDELIEQTKHKKTNLLPLVAFVTSKLVAYTVLGAILGALGSVVTLSPVFRGWMQIAIGIYLLGIAGALLDVHPFFRYFILKPPKFLARFVKTQSKGKNVMTPAILGALTIFIPCAVTQAMELVAVGSGSPVYGAVIMFAFVLGTTPTFSLLGFLYTKASEMFSGWFPKVAAVMLVTLAIFSINGGVAVMGSIYTVQNFIKAAFTPIDDSVRNVGNTAQIVDGVQEVTINVQGGGYSPNSIILKAGVKTRVTLVTNNTQGCSRAFTIPALRIQKILPLTGVETVEFTPTKGTLVFSCSMGMYTGQFNVI